MSAMCKPIDPALTSPHNSASLCKYAEKMQLFCITMRLNPVDPPGAAGEMRAGAPYAEASKAKEDFEPDPCQTYRDAGGATRTFRACRCSRHAVECFA